MQGATGGIPFYTYKCHQRKIDIDLGGTWKTMLTSPSVISRLHPRDTLAHGIELSRYLDPKIPSVSILFGKYLTCYGFIMHMGCSSGFEFPPAAVGVSGLFPQAGWSLLSLAHIKTLDEFIIRGLIGLGYLLQYKSRGISAIATFYCIVVYLVRAAKSLYLTAFAHHTNLSSFGGWTPDILRWSHQFIGHSPLLASNDADAATHTFIRDDRRLHLLGPGHFLHINGIKRAFLKAILAAYTFILVHTSLIAAATQKVKSVCLFERKEDFAAAGAAEASPCIDQTGLFVPAQDLQSFFQ
jgi:hypothetical protein